MEDLWQDPTCQIWDLPGSKCPITEDKTLAMFVTLFFMAQDRSHAQGIPIQVTFLQDLIYNFSGCEFPIDAVNFPAQRIPVLWLSDPNEWYHWYHGQIKQDWNKMFTDVHRCSPLFAKKCMYCGRKKKSIGLILWPFPEWYLPLSNMSLRLSRLFRPLARWSSPTFKSAPMWTKSKKALADLAEAYELLRIPPDTVHTHQAYHYSRICPYPGCFVLTQSHLYACGRWKSHDPKVHK